MRRSSRAWCAATILAALLILPAAPVPTARAADSPTGLDPTFGTGGVVVSDFGSDTESASSVTLQPDGKLLVSGSSGGSGKTARYTSSGALDPTFGTGGVAPIAASDIALQADGKLVVATSVPAGPGYCCRFAVARYTAAGAPDTSFGDGGVAVLQFAYEATAVAIQADGRIVAVGTAQGWPVGLATARLLADGTPDTSFSDDGMDLQTVYGDGGANDVAIDSSGRIVVAGWAGAAVYANSPDFAVLRYLANGTLDPSFDEDGIVTTDFGGNASLYERRNVAQSITLQPDGRIVVGGTGQFGAIVRYLANGSLDTAYGNGGISTSRALGSVSEIGFGTDGLLVAAGGVATPAGSDMALGRFDDDGWLDGRITTDLSPYDTIGGLAIQLDGKLVVAGSTTDGYPAPRHWVVARYSGIPATKSLLASPASVDLGMVTVGSAPAQATVTITNPGTTAAVNITAVALGTGASSTIAIADQGCPIGALAPKTSCDVALQFSPIWNGTATAELQIASDTDTSPLVIPVNGASILPASPLTWGTTYRAGPAYTWNSGMALGRTVQSGTQRLHLLYTTNRIGSSWARDTGPYAGVYYIRSTSGSTWTTAKRLNPSTQHALRLALGAAGSRVYAAWVSQTRIIKYSPTAPRVLYVRVNTNHGLSTSWRSPVRLTSTSGRVDYPSVAAYGYDVHVAWTDSVTGAVRVATSRDRGVTWKTRTVGSTTATTRDGKSGWPVIAVSGGTVAVGWIANGVGAIKMAVSLDRGSTWTAQGTLSPQSNWGLSVAVRGTRIALAYTTADAVVVRLRTAGVWANPLLAGDRQSTGGDSPQVYAPVVALQDPHRVGVAWADGATDVGDRIVTLRWTESTNDGLLWFAGQSVAVPASGRPVNDWASVLWPTAGERYLAWNGARDYSPVYRLYIRKGTGTPVGPAVAGRIWGPSDAEQTPIAREEVRTWVR